MTHSAFQIQIERLDLMRYETWQYGSLYTGVSQRSGSLFGGSVYINTYHHASTWGWLLSAQAREKNNVIRLTLLSRAHGDWALPHPSLHPPLPAERWSEQSSWMWPGVHQEPWERPLTPLLQEESPDLPLPSNLFTFFTFGIYEYCSKYKLPASNPWVKRPWFQQYLVPLTLQCLHSPALLLHPTLKCVYPQVLCTSFCWSFWMFIHLLRHEYVLLASNN